ncbi:MAG: TPR end-of-group domain-containing protein [Desulfobacterales bacterium]
MGVIFALAFVVRGLCLIGLADTHLLQMLIGDAELYDLWAKEILAEGWIGKKVFFQAPFYPYFLAVVYGAFGPDLLIVRWIQALIGAASCALIADVGRSFFSAKVGLVSGILLSLYPVAIFYDIVIQKAVLGLFFTVLILFLLERLSIRNRWPLWPVVGAVLGCLALVRENALILFPVVLFWLFIRFRQETVKKRTTWAVLICAGLFAVLFPVALRNRIVGGEWFLTTSNLGFNLYMGNRTDATGTYKPMVTGQGDWRFESEDARKLAELETGRQLSQDEISNYWKEKAIESIRSDPGAWMRLLLKKWKLLWGSLEMSDTESIYAYRDFSAILKGLGSIYHFGVLLPLAAAGFLLTWRLRERLWPMYLVLAAYTAGIVPFYVMARYRQPMVAVLVPFAAAGLVEMAKRVGQKEFRLLAAAFALSAGIAVFSNWPVMPASAVAATTYYNWGSVFENQGLINSAVVNYEKAVQLNPSHALSLNNLGILYCRNGDYAKGIRQFEKALKIDPGMAKTHSNIAIAFYHTGRLEDALHHFYETLRLDPEHDPIVDYNIACILSLQGEVAASIEHLKIAIGKGYHNKDQLLADPDLKNARLSPRFGKILEALDPLDHG